MRSRQFYQLQQAEGKCHFALQYSTTNTVYSLLQTAFLTHKNVTLSNINVVIGIERGDVEVQP